MTLVSLFRDAVARFSDQRAVSFENESLTYGELDRVSNQIAHVLADRYGVRSERIVALMMERSIHLVPALYGVLKAGGAYLPLDPDHPDDRLRHILDEARVACVLCDRDQIARLQRFGVPAVCVADLDLSECSDEALQIAIDPAHPAYVIYTSGSTGLPKGVLNEHRGICNLLYWLQEKYQIGDGDRMLQKTPYTFDVSVPEFFWPLNVGAQLIVAKPGGHRDPGYLAAVIRQTGITTTSFVPTMLRLFLEHPDAAHCTTLKRVLCAGEPLVSDLKQRFQHQLPGTRLFNLYGPTETAVYVTEWDCAAESPYGVVPIGYPIANTQIRILDEALKPLPIGVKGELYIGGAQVARGYVNRDDLTRERFISDPFSRNGGRLYRSGDICRWLPDGSVAYIGRADSQIKLKGLRIELGEIEAVISSHVDVAQCVVVVRNVSDTDRRLVAYLVAAEGATLDTENVRTYVTAKVPDYMVPAHLEVLAELPTTSSGKVDRRALPAPVLSTATEYVEPRNDIERYLAQTWQRMLQVDFVGVHDSFFELGGDSLQAAIFCNALSSVTDCYVSVVAVFEHSTVEGFANWLREEYPTAVESLATGNIAELAHTGSVNIEPVPNRATTLPLTEYQARTWFIDALEERNPAYNTMIALELRGQVDISALRNAIRELVDRHEILRTRYHVNNGRLVQSVRAVSEAPFSVVPMDTPWSDELMERCIRKEARRTFDLAAGEIMHASLYCGSDGAHLLVVDVHQIASDAWCRELLAEEIAGLYSLQISGSAKPLGTPKLQYGDFVLWNLDRLAGSDGDDGRAFWSRFLQGRGHVLDLPVNKLRPPVKTNQGASLQRTIDASLLRRVAELSGREHVSGFMILLACFYVLLARYCKQTDIEVGSTVACRERKETHGLMGRIANMIAVPASIDPARTFSELLAQVRENLLAAYAHQDYPLTRVLQDVVPPRDLSLTPLYQVVFAGETRPRSEPVMPGIEVRAIAVDKGFAKYDMTVIVMEEGEALTVDLEYNEDVFVEASMRQLLEDYAVLLGKLVGNPALPIAAAELEPARDRLTHGTNRTWIDGFPVDLDRVREALLALEPIDGCELRMDFVAGRNALVARYTGTKSDPDRLRQMLAWHVPAYMLPAAFVHTIDLADLPASATALPAGSDGQIDEKADGLIAQIVEQWRDLLGQPTIGAAGSFFAVGGNSMLALAAAHRATRSFGVPVSLRNFFETGTPRALAAHIRALRAVLSPAVPAQGRQEVRL
jgi:amino acid adenylation domain-containing protein